MGKQRPSGGGFSTGPRSPGSEWWGCHVLISRFYLFSTGLQAGLAVDQVEPGNSISMLCISWRCFQLQVTVCSANCGLTDARTSSLETWRISGNLEKVVLD